ncbi:MAG: CoA transferase [Hyphomicrobium sp.]
MTGKPSEKVGVVVIHGVGPTDEGWIDGYLIPEIEKWSAYDRVAGTARMPDPEDPNTNALVLSARAADDKWVAVALNDDGDFAAFAAAIGKPKLADDPAVKLRKDRIANRDELVDVIAEAFKAVPSGELLARLRRAFVPSTLAFRPESEVNRVRDPESSDTARTWRSFTRRWPLEKREVVVTEMFWADLSHGGGTILNRLIAMIELFLEAPFVLGHAFLGGNVGPFENMIRKLILISNWLMRWPIAGLNVSIFSACFAAMALHAFGRLDLLAPTVIITLIAVALTGLWATLEWQHRKPGLADIGLASLIAGLGLAAVVALCWMFADSDTMQSPPAYLNIAIRLILLFWFLWTMLNVTAVLLVTLMGLKRYFQHRIQRPKEGQRAAIERTVPLARPAAAIGLGVLIGIVWKLVLAILGILVIASIGSTRDAQISNCAQEMSLLDIVTRATDICQLAYAEQQLANVRDLNIAAALFVAFALFIVVKWRHARIATYPRSAMDGTLVLPRLIAHPLLIATLFALAVINATVFYVLPLMIGADAPLIFREMIFGSFDSTLPPALGFVLFIATLIFVAEHSDTTLHIGRDLVDHQYYRDPAWGSVKLQAALSQFVHKVTRGRWGEATPAPATGPQSRNYRRRVRIQRRLESLIDDVIRTNGIDRLVFLAHSQGTVILSDYLIDHNGLVGPAHHARDSLKGVERIDVLTMGSPLKHIYEHYYGDYEPPYEGGRTLDVDSWINMWRVDDPIGQDINPTACSKDGKICNIGIPPGGHQNYWKQAEICAVLWALIENRAPQTLPEILRIDRYPSRA